MPPRTRIKLLAGMAFLSLCAGGVGCQTSSLRTENHAASGAGRPGPLLALFHRPDSPAPTTVDGSVIASSNPQGWGPRPAAPVGKDGQASVWAPAPQVKQPIAQTGVVTRVSASPATGAATPASMNVPVAVANDPPPALKQTRLEPQAVVLGPAPVMLQPTAPHESATQPLPPYVIGAPDILLVSLLKDLALPEAPVDGQHLVRPDGTISLGIYGNVYVAGLTLDEARNAVAAQLHVLINKKEVEDIKKGLVVDVLAYNSKVYYVITDGAGYGEQVYPIAVTGNETVLDALAKINGLPPVASKKRIWVARAVSHETDHPEILPVDWCGITQRGITTTNYQIFPNDRIYVAADKWISTDSWLAKRLNPIERLFGGALLGSSTINSIRNKSTTGTGG